MDNQLLIKELYNAIAHSEPKRVKNILENYPCLLKIKTPIGSWLHVTAMHRNIDIVKYWVTSDIDINISGGICGSMPINFAVSEGHIEIVKYFLNKGAILDNSEPEKNPLFSAIHKGNLEIVKLRRRGVFVRSPKHHP